MNLTFRNRQSNGNQKLVAEAGELTGKYEGEFSSLMFWRSSPSCFGDGCIGTYDCQN